MHINRSVISDLLLVQTIWTWGLVLRADHPNISYLPFIRQWISSRSLSSSHINKLSQNRHQGFQAFYICCYLGIGTSHKAASCAPGFRVCFCRLLLPEQLMSQKVWLGAVREGRSALQQHPAASPAWHRVGSTGSHVFPKHHERSCWESMKSRSSTFWGCF